MTRILTTLFLIFSALTAQAGDTAERRIIGFSDDGKYFAFEQFGVQDGSGFPYSEVFILDTGEDRWVGGSPYRTRLEEEMVPVGAARAANASKARDALIRLNIRNPGRIVASNPPTELGNDPLRLRFRKYPNIDPIFELSIVEFAMNASGCDGLGVQTKGSSFAVRRQGGEWPSRLHEASSLPI